MLAVVIIITGLFIIIAILAQGATIHPTWKGPAVNEDIPTNYICQLFTFYYMRACGHRYTIFYPKSQATCVLEFRTFGIFRQALQCTVSVPNSPAGSGVARCTISHIHTCVGGSQDLVVVWGLAGRTHKTCT